MGVMPRNQHSQSHRFARPFHLVPPPTASTPTAPPTSTVAPPINVGVARPPLPNDLIEMKRAAAALNAALRQASWKALRMAHLRRRVTTIPAPTPPPYIVAQPSGAPTPPCHENGVQKLADELRNEKLVRKLQKNQTHFMTERLRSYDPENRQNRFNYPVDHKQSMARNARRLPNIDFSRRRSIFASNRTNDSHPDFNINAPEFVPKIDESLGQKSENVQIKNDSNRQDIPLQTKPDEKPSLPQILTLKDNTSNKYDRDEMLAIDDQVIRDGNRRLQNLSREYDDERGIFQPTKWLGSVSNAQTDADVTDTSNTTVLHVNGLKLTTARLRDVTTLCHLRGVAPAPNKPESLKNYSPPPPPHFVPTMIIRSSVTKNSNGAKGKKPEH